jgi:hypothetical protein
MRAQLPSAKIESLRSPIPFVGFSLLASALRRSKHFAMAGGLLAPTQAGATPNRLKRKAPDSSDAATTSTSAGEDEAAAGLEEEVEDLEREVADLGCRILEHRRDAAARFLDATVSRLAAFRPTACPGMRAFGLALLLGFPISSSPLFGVCTICVWIGRS